MDVSSEKYLFYERPSSFLPIQQKPTIQSTIYNIKVLHALTKLPLYAVGEQRML